MSVQLVRRALAAPLATPAVAAAAVSRRALSSSAPHLSAQSRKREARPEGGLRPTGLSPSPRAPRQYSALTVRLVEGLARVMGYNSTTSTAIRVTSDLYDACAQRSVRDDFWHEECGLPRTYQTWFQLTNLHVWLLIVRFRALPPKEAKVYTQEIVNHFFLDAESRMRDRFGISTSRLVKGYMRDLHQQQRGAVLGFDEGLAHRESDARLAAALWRNIWGQGWGVVGGVKRKIKGIDHTNKGEDPSEEGAPELARDRAAPAQADAEPQLVLGGPPSPLEFPEHLLRLVKFVRSETMTRAEWSDYDVRMGGQPSTRRSLAYFEQVKKL